MNVYYTLLLYGSLFFIVLVSHFRFITRREYWLFDVFSNFVLQYCLYAIAAFFLALWTYDYLLGVLALYLLILNGSVFLNGGRIKAKVTDTNEFVSVYLANIWCRNTRIDPFQEEITSINPGCVFLMEINAAHIKSLESLINQYPHRIFEPRDDTTGFLFLSQYPIIDFQIVDHDEHGNRPILKAQIEIASKIVSFYGVHPHTSISRQKFWWRNNLLKWLERQVSSDPNPVIVVGDFNTTTFSLVFRRFLVQSGLIDSRKWNGIPPTWPKYFPLLWLPLDHVLVNFSFDVVSDKLGRAIGSDHFAKVVTLSFNG